MPTCQYLKNFENDLRISPMRAGVYAFVCVCAYVNAMQIELKNGWMYVDDL